MLECIDVSGRRGGRLLFRHLSLRLDAGEALWVQGPNGVGKTTLLRQLCGLSLPAGGRILWEGRAIARPPEAFHHDLLWLPDQPALKDELSPVENLVVMQALTGRPCTTAQARDALAAVGLAGVADLPTRWLSHGQRRRAALARLHLPARPGLLVLDEPFNGLDADVAAALNGTLSAHLAAGAVVVYTTHLPQRVQAQRLHVLSLGVAIEAC